MGQSSYNPNGGGGTPAGINWWTNGGAGTDIAPIAPVTSVNATFGNQNFNVTSAFGQLFQLIGNVIFQLVTNTFNVLVQVKDIVVGNGAAIDVRIGAIASTVTDTTGGQSTNNQAPLSIQQIVTDSINLSGFTVSPTEVGISMLNGAGDNPSTFVNVNGFEYKNAASKKFGIDLTGKILTNQKVATVIVLPVSTIGYIPIYDTTGTLVGRIPLI